MPRVGRIMLPNYPHHVVVVFAADQPISATLLICAN